jgi:hypothetical protein
MILLIIFILKMYLLKQELLASLIKLYPKGHFSTH